MNQTTITGRLTKDAAFREFEGSTVANFTIANNDKGYKDSKSGEWIDKAIYVECNLWMASEKYINHIRSVLNKGVEVLLTGTVEAGVYSKSDTPTAKLILKVETIQVFSPKTQNTTY